MADNDPLDNAANTSAETENTEETTEQRIPKTRFDKVNAARRVAEAELATLKEAEQKRQEAESLAKGEYQKIIDALKPDAERAKELEKTLKAYLEAEIADIPEDRRDLIPDGDTTMQLKWVKNAKAKGVFGTPKAPNMDAGVTGDRVQAAPKLTADEAELARMAGMSNEQYASYKGGGKAPVPVAERTP